jgi:hypothetical protein
VHAELTINAIGASVSRNGCEALFCEVAFCEVASMAVVVSGQVNQGQPVEITVNSGLTLTVTTDVNSSGLVRRVGEPGNQLLGNNVQNVPASGKAIVGAYGNARYYRLEVTAGFFTYQIAQDDSPPCTLKGNVEAFTGNRTLKDDDNGKVLRCDDSSSVTITVPNNLAEGFNVAFAMWDVGTVTIAAGSGATNRSGTSQITTQYLLGSLIVLKNSDGATAEFALAGNFT